MEFEEIMKKAEDVKNKLEEFKKELSSIRVQGSAGIDMAIVNMDGNGLVVQLSLSEALLKESKEVQESLILSAVNDASQKVKQEVADKQKSLIGMPSMMDFPFKG